MLLPALNRAREAGFSTDCLNRQKQIGVMLINYMFFGKETYDLANYFTKQLETNLIAANYFTIIDTKEALAALNMGRMPPSDIFITGKIYNVYSKIKEKEVKTSKDSEETHIEYYRVLNYSVLKLKLILFDYQ